MADQAVVKSFTPCVSENPEGGFQRFKDDLRQIVSGPKKAVEKSIAEESEQKKQRKQTV